MGWATSINSQTTISQNIAFCQFSIFRNTVWDGHSWESKSSSAVKHSHGKSISLFEVSCKLPRMAGVKCKLPEWRASILYLLDAKIALNQRILFEVAWSWTHRRRIFENDGNLSLFFVLKHLLYYVNKDRRTSTTVCFASFCLNENRAKIYECMHSTDSNSYQVDYFDFN